MLGVPIFENSRFSAANIRKTVEDFADVKELEVTPADGRYLEPMQNFYLTDILCIVMICLFCFRLFGFDHDSGMGNLLQTAVLTGAENLGGICTGDRGVSECGISLHGGNLSAPLSGGGKFWRRF